ncbi:MAG: hypothetical protein L0I76_33830, partial [Pseudonocardia sp.]|nr:hypothetical protein [Pseudonocardia sp.]
AGEPVSATGPDGAGPTAADGHTDRGHTDRAHAGSDGVGPPGGTGDATAESWSLPGVRLGGTDGGRASERRGVVVPTLPDQPGD